MLEALGLLFIILILGFSLAVALDGEVEDPS